MNRISAKRAYNEDIGAELIGKAFIILGFYGSGRVIGWTVRGATVTLGCVGRHWKLESDGEICESLYDTRSSTMILRCFPVSRRGVCGSHLMMAACQGVHTG